MRAPDEIPTRPRFLEHQRVDRSLPLPPLQRGRWTAAVIVAAVVVTAATAVAAWLLP